MTPGGAEPGVGNAGSRTLRTRAHRSVRSAIDSSPLRPRTMGDDKRAKSLAELTSLRLASTGEGGKRLSRLTTRLSATTTPLKARPHRMVRLPQVPLANHEIGHKCGTSD